MSYVLGLDVGGTKISISLGIREGEEIKIIGKIKEPTPAGYENALSMMEEACLELIARNDAGVALELSDVSGVGISCGGPLDSRRGIVLSPANLPGWDGVRITEYYESMFGVPAALQNDANACAVAEWKYGAGRGAENMIFLTFGTGLGAGLILNGALYAGTNDMAGEAGRWSMPQITDRAYGPVGYGKAGSIEGFCSGGGIAQLGRAVALERIQIGGSTGYCAGPKELDGITAQSIALAAEAGDEAAKYVYEICGRYMGCFLGMLIDVLNPQVIVLGSIYVRSARLIDKAMYEALDRESHPRGRGVCRILPAMLGEELGDIAALSIAPV